MTETRYYVKNGSDGKPRFYIEEANVQIKSSRQAKKADIKLALNDIAQKREHYDKALLEYVQ